MAIMTKKLKAGRKETTWKGRLFQRPGSQAEIYQLAIFLYVRIEFGGYTT